MNNNNLYNTNNFIGITHNDYFKTASNALSTAIINTSNILELHSSNFTSNYANITEINSSNYANITSNNILARYDPLIGEKIFSNLLPPSTQINTYIYNSNNLGDICFKTSFNYPINSNLTGTKIDYTGKLLVYHNYNVLQPLFAAGYYDVEGEILALKADGIATETQLTGIEGTIVFVQGEIDTLVQATNLLEGEINAIASAIYFNNTFDDFKTCVENANLVQVGATYAGLINSISLTGTQLYNSSVSSGLFSTALFGFAVGAIGAISTGLYYQYASNALMSNIHFTGEQKRAIYESNIDNQLQTYNEYSTALSNINLIQGFINSNIQTQQYIKNLKCETLDLNTGNISNINGINANEIIAAGKIKQNNILLDDTYLTSNHLYNLAYNYTSERQYPSKLYNTILQQDTITLGGLLKYRTGFYLDNQSIAYGSGVYEIYYSSQYDTNTRAENLFNYDTSQTTTSARFGITLYSSGTGDYLGSDKINNYYGDWVIIKMNQEILLSRYRIYQRTDAPTKAPALWKVFGSKDGITFTEITQASQTTRLTSYTNNYYEKTLASFTTLYQYFGFVFGSLLSVSGQTDLSFAELQIFGKEIISNTITSQIYTTSNIAKNLIIYQTPEVCKHFAFYCQTSSVIYINGGNTPYYKYDIDMTNYTTTGYIQIGSGSNDPYRIFRIRAFLGSCYFSKLTNGLPDILNYEIYMSSKAAAGGSGTTAGINIFAIGYPNNSSLNIIPPNNLFILSNPANTFNYITLVSTSPADCRVIIEDLIS